MVCRVLDTGPDTGVYTLAEALYGRYCRFIMWVIGGVWGEHRSGCSRLTDERGSGSTLDTVELAELAECFPKLAKITVLRVPVHLGSPLEMWCKAREWLCSLVGEANQTM